MTRFLAEILSKLKITRWFFSEPFGHCPFLTLADRVTPTVDSTVTTEAVVDNLLAVLSPNRHELVLFDINRFAAKSMLLTADPGPLTNRLMADETLPFALTLIVNENPSSTRVIARRKATALRGVRLVLPLPASARYWSFPKRA